MIGDIFPDFDAVSTQGNIQFRSWAEGSWVYLFSHPLLRTPVCLTEMVALQRHVDDFRARNTRIIGVTGSTVGEHAKWEEEIEEDFFSKITFPVIAEPTGVFARDFGMIHPKQSGNLPIRKVMILDPAMRVRIILEYPPSVGRSITEILRVLDALQASDKTGLFAPGDWQPGQDMVVPVAMPTCDAQRQFGDRLRVLRPYLRFVRPAQ